jgi:hypothetical protein
MNIQGVNLSGTNIKDASFVTGNSQLLYLDAANSTSYPGTGTVWYDLSGNSNNTTGYGGTAPAYSSSNGGYFSFNGSNYFQTAGSKYNVSYTGKTIFIAANMSTAMASASFRCMFGAGGTPSNRTFNTYMYNNSGSYQIHWSASGTGGFSSNLTYTPTNWFTVAVTQNGAGLLSYYFNGTLINTASSTLAGFAGDQYEQVGASDNNWTGPVSVVAVYGSALTATQIGQCHNNVCARYGLRAVLI